MISKSISSLIDAIISYISEELGITAQVSLENLNNDIPRHLTTRDLIPESIK